MMREIMALNSAQKNSLITKLLEQKNFLVTNELSRLMRLKIQYILNLDKLKEEEE
jgi:hypothetical protein